MIQSDQIIEETLEIYVGYRSIDLLVQKGEASIPFHPQGERVNPKVGQPVIAIDRRNTSREVPAVIKRIDENRGRRNGKIMICLERVM